MLIIKSTEWLGGNEENKLLLKAKTDALKVRARNREITEREAAEGVKGQ